MHSENGVSKTDNGMPQRRRLTRAHKEGTSATERCGKTFVGGKTEVRQIWGRAVLTDEDVFRLQIPMEDMTTMAGEDGIHNLEEYLPQQLIVLPINTISTNLIEKSAAVTIFEDDVNMFVVLEYTVHGDDIGMSCHRVVQAHFSLDSLGLRLRKTSLSKNLYSPVGRGVIGS